MRAPPFGTVQAAAAGCENGLAVTAAAAAAARCCCCALLLPDAAATAAAHLTCVGETKGTQIESHMQRGAHLVAKDGPAGAVRARINAEDRDLCTDTIKAEPPRKGISLWPNGNGSARKGSVSPRHSGCARITFSCSSVIRWAPRALMSVDLPAPGGPATPSRNGGSELARRPVSRVCSSA